MTTYYELLQLQSTASQAEIEAALDTQYSTWRRLVTHHDPQTVQRANQTLLLLEQARSTLTNAASRASYDASLSPGAAGLADPTAQPASPRAHPLPPPPRPAAPVQPAVPETVERVDAWLCPKCQSANPVHSMYCKKCGQALAQICGQCGTTYELQAAFCPSCGSSAETVSRRRELQAQLQALQRERQTVTGNASGLRQKAWITEALAVFALGWAAFMLGALGLFLPFSVLRGGWLYLVSLLPDLRAAGDAAAFLFNSVNGLARLLVWAVSIGTAVFLAFNTRRGLSQLLTVAGYFFAMTIGVLLAGTELDGPIQISAALLWPSMVAAGVSAVAALSMVGRERLALPAAAAAVVFGGLIWCSSPLNSIVSLFAAIPHILLMSILTFVGFRGRVLAELDYAQATMTESDATVRAAQLDQEIQGLTATLQQLETRTG